MSDPQPDLRIGDAERETALRLLGEHMAAGRLDVEEYGDRSATATTARTRGDLLALFSDLPEPKPRFDAPARAPHPGRLARRPGPPVALAPVLLALMITLVIATKGLALPFLIAPLMWLAAARGRHWGGRP
ncbi:DUF1707 SHOCT-like domain-containing protein [Actinokineospora bangkokensis]|uniref:DUF1707 domain-containing protein n=1 Tax=Actinokineospora bangkokensis TaxID=1193682 RepID=A0A1Q9LEP7_9PSEU|nr:DUF1707 domain-containing protein [Actinokineospora bangkokensis]OLR90490.1 hypothetical protein BJP25_28045 [Actinokineospora bangkokensis]